MRLSDGAPLLIYSDARLWWKVRELVVNELLAHRDNYEDFLVMRDDNAEIQAAANAMGLEIIIEKFTRGGAYIDVQVVKPTRTAAGTGPQRTVRMVHHGEDHYNSLARWVSASGCGQCVKDFASELHFLLQV